MRMNTERFEEMFDEFALRCPEWAARTLEYQPKTINSIRITLDDGTKLDYNPYSRIIHWVKGAAVESADHIREEDCRESFSANLTNIMQVRGVTQNMLSDRTGISTCSISKYMNRKATPSLTVLKKLALALDCMPDELMID